VPETVGFNKSTGMSPKQQNTGGVLSDGEPASEVETTTLTAITNALKVD
jgi:hypothetical protein